jgi:hypothetical protein
LAFSGLSYRVIFCHGGDAIRSLKLPASPPRDGRPAHPAPKKRKTAFGVSFVTFLTAAAPGIGVCEAAPTGGARSLASGLKAPQQERRIAAIDLVRAA